jgi:hypothetical protein
MKAESTELTVLAAPLVPAIIFAEGGVDAILNQIRAEVSAVEIDISTPNGRRECASLAYKVARSKTALDDMGKELGEDHYRAWKGITSERARLVKELDALKDDVRRPLTDWENADKARIAAHQAAIDALIESSAFYAAENASDDLRQRLAFLQDQPPRDWQEFSKRADDALSSEIAKTKVALAEAEARESAIAEAARATAEKAEAERRARDLLIAENARRDAEAKAAVLAAQEAKRVEAERRAATEKAQQEREAIDAERRAAEAREQREREARIAAEIKAKADADAAAARALAEQKAAAERAERDKQAAIEAERHRVAAENAAASADAARREADKRHRARVNGESLAALVAFAGLTEDQAKAVITAVVRHEIPHVSLTY